MSLRWLVTLVLLGWCWSAPIARAHDGPPRVELGADRVPPGANLVVRGVNLVPDTFIEVELISVEAHYTLGAAQGDEHGDFTQGFIVPAEAVAGDYLVQVSVEHYDLASTPLVLAGAAVIEAEGEAQRDEDEPLLAPMPTFAPGIVPGAAPAITQAAPTEAFVSPPVSEPAPAPLSIPWMPLTLGLLAATSAGLLVAGLARQRGARRRS